MRVVGSGKRSAAAAVASPAGVRTLADLPRGVRCIIAGIAAPDPKVSRRLSDLGFARGSAVELVRVAPLGDTLIVRVAGYELALRRAQARLVELEPEPLP